MVTAVTSGYTAIVTANGRVVPDELPPVYEGDTVRLAFDLRPFLGTDTVSGTFTLTDEPNDLTLSNSARINTNTGVALDATGFQPGVRYEIQLSATLTAGAVIAKRLYVRCADPRSSTDYV